MGHLIFLLVSLALAAGFLAVTRIEAARGAKFFAEPRARLDREIARITFIYEHVDFAAFLRDVAHALAVEVGQWLAHVSLKLVRNVERLLTTVVRDLHRRVAALEHSDTGGGDARPFVRELSSFKRELTATHPVYPELQ